MKIYRCQHCSYNVILKKNTNTKEKVSAKHKMGEHYETKHKSLLPPDMTGYRWFYYLLTGKDRGSCVECKGETEFNESSMKYGRFCKNPMCKQAYRDRFKKRMIDKYGRVHLLDDPEMQKKMQAGRRIAGIYTWSDGKTQFGYLSSYELHFLKFLDTELHWPASDLFSPSPHTYVYEYEGKSHYYMPDFYIPSINCEIEIKDDGSAKNINPESRAKDEVKDAAMKSLYTMINYIKIVNKDYTKFLNIIKEV